MMQTLVAALAIGFVPGGKDVTEMRPAARWLIVGTWEVRDKDGRVTVWEFSSNGRVTHGIELPPFGRLTNKSGTYRVEGRLLVVEMRGPLCASAPEIVRLDDHVLVVRWNETRFTQRFRRR